MDILKKNSYPILPRQAAFIPEWSCEIQHRNCPLCLKENDSLFIRSDDLPLAYCSQCRLWYISEVPSQDCLQTFYKTYYKIVNPVEFNVPLANGIKNNTTNALRLKDYDVRIQCLLSLFYDVSNKKVLEIGCGTGQWLYLLKELGMEVTGFEISEEACEFCQTYLNLRVYKDDFLKCIHKIENQDVVFMNDLIEHLTDPAAYLKAAREVLNPGGYLFIWTPNGGQAGTSIDTAMNWVGFSMDLEHLQYFSSSVMIKIANDLNFDIVHLETLGFPILEKLKNNQPSKIIQRVLDIRFKMLNHFNMTFFGRILRVLRKEFMREKDPRLGSYIVFAILQKPYADK